MIRISLPLALGLLPLLWLTGCDSDSSTQFQQQYAGQYNGALIKEGEAAQLRLAINEQGVTLTQLDAREQVSALSGEIKAGGVSFGDGSRCTPQSSGFLCTLSGQAVSLSQDEASTQVELAALAGDYQLVHDDELGSLTLAADGQLTALLGSCSIQGQLSLQGTQIRVQVSSDSCGQGGAVGTLQASSLPHTLDTLEVWIPDSSLAGFWLR